ncbi:MAG: GNAT family N-acetyltransferase [Clostridia bacterium]|nr:GNAT family N-acetyltransferase [Clostridia bacterium]
MKEQAYFLEEIAANGHVALNVMQYDGWLLRFSEGFTGRANSVSVIYPSRKGIEEKVAYCEKCYAKQGLPTLFKVTEYDTELSDYLDKRGYEVVTPTDVMILDLEKTDLAADMNECVFSGNPKEWLQPYFEFEKQTDPVKQDLFRRIQDKVLVDKVYCIVMQDGKPAACASTASEQGYALLHNVVVDPEQRGKGLGEKLCRAILAKAKEDGAKYAYLQVVQGNNVALNLYQKIGFTKLYTYWYLRKK